MTIIMNHFFTLLFAAFCLTAVGQVCENPNACNYGEEGECEYFSCYNFGCTNPGACNYDPTADINDNSCEYLTCIGCTNPEACDFDPNATIAGPCLDYTSCLDGCTDPSACNYGSEGVCAFPEIGRNCSGDCLQGDEDFFVSLLPLGTVYSPSNFGFQLDVSGDCSLYQSESGQFQMSTGSFGYDLYADSDLYIECNDMTDGYYRYIYYEVDLMDSCCQEIDLLVTYMPSPEAGCPSQVVASTTVSCVCGCTDINACNYDDTANFDQFSSCDYGCLGCTDEQACNYDQTATMDDGTCASCEALATACGEGTVWDANTSTCIVANPSDSNFDGCVQLNDLLDLLSAYGDCGAEESPWQCGDPLEYQGYEYETVQIGEQCWFAENLRAENYRNGDPIPAGLSGSDWLDTTNGAVAVFGEGSSDCNNLSIDGDACDEAWSLNEYGRLYNWHAVDDTRSLCPGGWHVPSDGEWMAMEMTLGMSEAEANSVGIRGSNQGSQMKMHYGWYDGGNGSNSSGFAGLPGGNRANSFFSDAGNMGYWWSSTPDDPSSTWGRLLFSYYTTVIRSPYDHQNGFSVRCIED